MTAGNLSNGLDGNESSGLTSDSPAIGGHYWVKLRYDIFDATGEPIDDVQRNLTYLHGGYGEVLPKIEAALEAKRAGESISLYLEPDDAYGDYDADLVMLLPVEKLPSEAEIGMAFDGIPGEANDGHIYNVTDIAQGHAVLDGNHPLAGIGLRFDVIIESVWEASDEEIELEQRAAAKSQD